MSKQKCTKELYKAFLQTTSVRHSSLALSEVSPIKLSHDSVSRWLSSKKLRPRDLWQAAKSLIKDTGVLIVDDTVIDKSRSQKIELVKYQYSGNAHGTVAGIAVVNLIWGNWEKYVYSPADYRIYHKASDGKTKNQHLRNMLKLAKQRDLQPESIVMDSWYSSVKNLKAIKSHGWTWVTGLRKNRIVNKNLKLELLTIPAEGLLIYLRGYGWVTVFKFAPTNRRIDYIATSIANASRAQVEQIMQTRWQVEVYHRELKQTCGIGRCQALTGRAQRNHIFMSIAAWIERQKRRLTEGLSFYQQTWDVVKHSISANMQSLLTLPKIPKPAG